eukprot:scaffold2707_cov417-Prasinococcus_capsulatus_cf.AAC.37
MAAAGSQPGLSGLLEELTHELQGKSTSLRDVVPLHASTIARYQLFGSCAEANPRATKALERWEEAVLTLVDSEEASTRFAGLSLLKSAVLMAPSSVLSTKLPKWIPVLTKQLAPEVQPQIICATLELVTCAMPAPSPYFLQGRLDADDIKQNVRRESSGPIAKLVQQACRVLVPLFKFSSVADKGMEAICACILSLPNALRSSQSNIMSQALQLGLQFGTCLQHPV